MKQGKAATIGVASGVRKPQRQASTASRFVACPICGLNVPQPTINDHLDACVSTKQPASPKQPADASLPYNRDQSVGASDTKRAGVQWWKGEPGRPGHVASGKLAGFGRQSKPQPLTAEQLRQAVPCELVANVLPQELADALLQELAAKAEGWKRGTWHMFGQAHAAPRTSCYFELTPAEDKRNAPAEGITLDIAEDVGAAAPSNALRQASRLVNDAVSTASGRLAEQLLPDDRRGWASSYALANCYSGGQEGVGPHSDRLQTLGPRAIIASLSLGATRTFRISRAKPRGQAHESESDTVHNANSAEAAAAAVDSRGELSSVDIPLPHNTLVIMWPPMQEEWKHEVPKTKSVRPHPLSGCLRINLTFRKLKPDWVARAPSCRCGRQAVLKAAVGQGRGALQRYFYQCDNTRGAACGFWKWVDAAELGLG